MFDRLLRDGDENKGLKRKRSESKTCWEVIFASPTNQAQDATMRRAHYRRGTSGSALLGSLDRRVSCY